MSNKGKTTKTHHKGLFVTAAPTVSTPPHCQRIQITSATYELVKKNKSTGKCAVPSASNVVKNYTKLLPVLRWEAMDVLTRLGHRSLVSDRLNDGSLSITMNAVGVQLLKRGAMI